MQAHAIVDRLRQFKKISCYRWSLKTNTEKWKLSRIYRNDRWKMNERRESTETIAEKWTIRWFSLTFAKV